MRPRSASQQPPAVRRCAFADLPYPGTQDEGDAPPVAGEGSKEEEGPTQSAPGMHSYVRQCCVDKLGTDGFIALISALRALPDAETSFSEIALQHAGGACREG